MGELIIHIDQDSGAVTKVIQEIKSEEKEAIINYEENEVENRIISELLKVLEEVDKERADLNKRADAAIIEQLKSTKGSFPLELPPLGDIYNDHPKIVKLLKEWRDTFDRIVAVPVELWERAGNTVCTIRVGGTIRRCRHRK